MGSKVFLLVAVPEAPAFSVSRRRPSNATALDCIQPTQRDAPSGETSGRNQDSWVLTIMKSTILKILLACLSLAFLLIVVGVAESAAQQATGAGQATQPGGVTGGAANAPAETNSPTRSDSMASTKSSNHSAANASDDNPYDPILEPPPLPKGKPTLIGGIATSVDQVRYRLTLAPFGGGAKVKLSLDERTHIFRDGTETTVLAIHKGDRVYADTMLDGGKVFAKNVRVITEPGIAEVRGQVMATDAQKGTVRVQDQLSARPVTFSVSGATKYSSFKGNANSADVQPGALVDVQFAVGRSNHDVAQEIVVLAKPGDDYVFSGVVTNLDLRSDTLALENRSDQETYDLHFNPAAMEDSRQLKVGSEVTAHATFDGKQYRASNLRIEKTNSQDQAVGGQDQDKVQ
jgi:hypothetical protein